MSLVLYGVPVSAFVAKVRVVLDLKGAEYDEREPPGGYGSDAYRAIVPAGSVPGLVADGAPLHDSNAIVEFLDETFPDPPLMPAAPLVRARIRALLGFHDARLEASTRALFPLVKRDWRAEAPAVDAAFAGVAAALERFEALISPGPFALGEGLTLADAGPPCTLQMARMLGDEMGREVSLPPKTAALAERLAGIPAVARSLAIHREAMEAWLAGFRR